MPLVTLRTGFHAPDGREEALTEYLCDWPGCPNVAVHTLGVLVELRLMTVVCDEHLPNRRVPPRSDARDRVRGPKRLGAQVPGRAGCPGAKAAAPKVPKVPGCKVPGARCQGGGAEQR